MSGPRDVEGRRQVVESLAVNATIVVVKIAAAVITGSGSMLAEALHSGADCSNQILLLVGIREAKRPPDATHPLGYGRNAYFWSFLVALMLFLGGGVFSVQEGVHKMLHPEPAERLWIAIAVLAVSLLLEGSALLSNIRELRARSGGRPFFRYLRETKDSDLVILFAENSADSLGLTLALAAIGLTQWTKDPRWDGLGSLVIGLVLIVVSTFLAREVKSLLAGEAADADITEAALAAAAQQPEMRRVLNVITIQQGPGEVLVSIKVAFAHGLTIEQASEAINAFEARLRAARREVRWLFVEPDVPHDERMSKMPPSIS
ncbi:MAG: cation diffusion facilitator family transporter [Polyangiales bacterium]